MNRNTLLIVVMVIILSLQAIETRKSREAATSPANSKPRYYRGWPKCRRDTEYVTVIREEDRKAGQAYHTRTDSRGREKAYICQPCTQCPFGVEVLEVCSRHQDTHCSSYCAVEACILDDILHFCRPPGDPGQFESISEMEDLCDPTKVNVPTTSHIILPSKGVFPTSLMRPDSIQRPNPDSAQSSQDENNVELAVPGTLPAGAPSGSARGKSVEVALLASELAIVVVLATVVGVVGLFVHYKKKRRNRHSSPSDNNESVLIGMTGV